MLLKLKCVILPGESFSNVTAKHENINVLNSTKEVKRFMSLNFVDLQEKYVKLYVKDLKNKKKTK